MRIEDSRQYFFSKGGDKQGPVSGAVLRGLAQSGELDGDSYV